MPTGSYHYNHKMLAFSRWLKVANEPAVRSFLHRSVLADYKPRRSDCFSKQCNF